VGFTGAVLVTGFTAFCVAGAAILDAAGAALIGAFAGAFVAVAFADVAFAAGTFTLCMDGPFFSSATGAFATVSFLVSSVFFLLNNAIIDLHSD
jgi:hypothetical protein